MKKVKILAFAQAKSIVGFSEKEIEMGEEETPKALLERLVPGSWEKLRTMRVAIDEEYEDWEAPVGKGVELAIIPPVSGG